MTFFYQNIYEETSLSVNKDHDSQNLQNSQVIANSKDPKDPINSLDSKNLQKAISTDCEYELFTQDGISTEKVFGKIFLSIKPEIIERLAEKAFIDISHFLRSSHLEKLSNILNDPEASSNDRFVALDLLKNAVIAAEGVFPSCQDTGTAIVIAKKGDQVWTEASEDRALLSKGIYEAFQKKNLRYSQMAPLTMYEEKNTGSNLPAQIDIYSVSGNEYHFLFLAKGGGSANKTYLFQKTKALLNPSSMESFLRETLKNLGTSACPPYHLALVIGGTSAEETLKVAKLTSTGYYDHLPVEGNIDGRAFRDLHLEQLVTKWAQETKIGAQFGGKYLVHDVRVVRLPRHGASCPVGLAVSCSADRNLKAKITAEGVFIEKLEKNPARFLPKAEDVDNQLSINLEKNHNKSLRLDLNLPMPEILKTLSQLKVSSRVMLDGPLIVARDVAHAKLFERLQKEGDVPDYLKQYGIYYAGPAKTPLGFASGSFGPTTSERMDPYVSAFQAKGGSLLMLGKGNRNSLVVESCKTYGGFYLGTIGGSAARLGKECITHVEVLEYKELGMEAIWKIQVKDFPAFVIIDDKGNDFYS